MITCKRKQNIHSRKEEASLLLLCQKWPVDWLLSWLPVNWKIANVPGSCVLSFWTEQSCCGACLLYLWLHGVPTVLWELQGLGKKPFEELLGRVTCSISFWSATSFALAASVWVLGLAQPLHLFARVRIHSFTSSFSLKYTQEHTGALLLGHAEGMAYPEDLTKYVGKWASDLSQQI